MFDEIPNKLFEGDICNKRVNDEGNLNRSNEIKSTIVEEVEIKGNIKEIELGVAGVNMDAKRVKERAVNSNYVAGIETTTSVFLYRFI